MPVGLQNSVCCSTYSKLSKKQELSEMPIIWESKERTDCSRGGGLYQRGLSNKAGNYQHWWMKVMQVEWRGGSRAMGPTWHVRNQWALHWILPTLRNKASLGIMNRKCKTDHCLHIFNTISIPGTVTSRRGRSKLGKGIIKGIEWVLQGKKNSKLGLRFQQHLGVGRKRERATKLYKEQRDVLL